MSLESTLLAVFFLGWAAFGIVGSLAAAAVWIHRKLRATRAAKEDPRRER